MSETFKRQEEPQESEDFVFDVTDQDDPLHEIKEIIDASNKGKKDKTKALIKRYITITGNDLSKKATQKAKKENPTIKREELDGFWNSEKGEDILEKIRKVEKNKRFTEIIKGKWVSIAIECLKNKNPKTSQEKIEELIGKSSKNEKIRQERKNFTERLEKNRLSLEENLKKKLGDNFSFSREAFFTLLEKGYIGEEIIITDTGVVFENSKEITFNEIKKFIKTQETIFNEEIDKKVEQEKKYRESAAKSKFETKRNEAGKELLKTAIMDDWIKKAIANISKNNPNNKLKNLDIVLYNNLDKITKNAKPEDREAIREYLGKKIGLVDLKDLEKDENIEKEITPKTKEQERNDSINYDGDDVVDLSDETVSDVEDNEIEEKEKNGTQIKNGESQTQESNSEIPLVTLPDRTRNNLEKEIDLFINEKLKNIEDFKYVPKELIELQRICLDLKSSETIFKKDVILLLKNLPENSQLRQELAELLTRRNLVKEFKEEIKKHDLSNKLKIKEKELRERNIKSNPVWEKISDATKGFYELQDWNDTVKKSVESLKNLGIFFKVIEEKVFNKEAQFQVDLATEAAVALLVSGARPFTLEKDNFWGKNEIIMEVIFLQDTYDSTSGVLYTHPKVYTKKEAKKRGYKNPIDLLWQDIQRSVASYRKEIRKRAIRGVQQDFINSEIENIISNYEIWGDEKIQ